MSLLETIRGRLQLSAQLRDAVSKKNRGMPGWDPVIRDLERQLAFCPPAPAPDPRSGRPRQDSLFGYQGAQGAGGSGVAYTGSESGTTDLSQIPIQRALEVYQTFGPSVDQISAVIYTVPLNMIFLLVYGFMATNNGGPPAIGSGLDFVPLNSSLSKQTFGDSASNSHLEGIYLMQPIPEGSAWTGNQVSMYKLGECVIPSGATIRTVRSNAAVPNTNLFAKIAGYTISTKGDAQFKPDGGNYKLPAKGIETKFY